MTGLYYLTGTINMTVTNLAISDLTWICGRLLFGCVMKQYMEMKGQKTKT